jgi:hypothetical protein
MTPAVSEETGAISIAYHYVILIPARLYLETPGNLALNGGPTPQVIPGYGICGTVDSDHGQIPVTVRIFDQKPAGLARTNARTVSFTFPHGGVAIARFVDSEVLTNVPLPAGAGRYKVHVHNLWPTDPLSEDTDESVVFTLWPEGTRTSRSGRAGSVSPSNPTSTISGHGAQESHQDHRSAGRATSSGRTSAG